MVPSSRTSAGLLATSLVSASVKSLALGVFTGAVASGFSSSKRRARRGSLAIALPVSADNDELSSVSGNVVSWAASLSGIAFSVDEEIPGYPVPGYEDNGGSISVSGSGDSSFGLLGIGVIRSKSGLLAGGGETGKPTGGTATGGTVTGGD